MILFSSPKGVLDQLTTSFKCLYYKKTLMIYLVTPKGVLDQIRLELV